jgi:hypothetical protein
MHCQKISNTDVLQGLKLAQKLNKLVGKFQYKSAYALVQ